MRTSFVLALTAFSALSLSAVAGCGSRCGSADMFAAGSGDRSASPPNASNAGSAGTSSPADASRAISEADIVQLDHEQNRVYAMSKAGTLAIVDAAQPAQLTLLGKTALAGVPFEMYRRGNIMLTMSNNGVAGDGQVRTTLSDGSTPLADDAKGGALLSAVDIADPAHARTLGTFKVPGEIADSRIIGNILYLATYENGQCWSCMPEARTLVTTFDIADATAPRQIDQVAFLSPATPAGNTWATPWKRSIVATKDRLYVGGIGIADTTSQYGNEGRIEVLDITDPSGHLTRGATISTAGPVLSRWQLDEVDGVLRVVSQHGAGRTQNGDAFPVIATFRVDSASSFTPLGQTTMSLPRQEGLKTVRFDGARAYAITFNETDPLFTIDLADPAKPVQAGELHIPGWVYHLEPRGDRLIGLGLDRRDHAGNLNVSLFDVSDMAHPALVERTSFGPTNMYTDREITTELMAEDQDRIQKAFRIFDDGLITVPFSATDGSSYGSVKTNGCSANTSGVQLISWTKTALTKHALLPVTGSARRAIRRDSASMKEVITVSDTNVTSFSINQRDLVSKTADVVIGTCSPSYPQNGGHGMPTGGHHGGGYQGGYQGGYDNGMGGPWNGGTCE